MRTAKQTILLTIAIALFTTFTFAADGDLDTAFSVVGYSKTQIESFVDVLTETAIQSDGKIVVAGYSGNDILVVRYNTNGSLDTTFDGDGIVKTAIGTSISRANSLAIQADGKIVVAGFVDDGTIKDFALVRYNTNGSLDTTFSSDGVVTRNISSSDTIANSVAIQSDGKIVISGNYVLGATDIFSARYNTTGTLDTTFGNSGIFLMSSGFSGTGNSVAIQSDGKIVVGTTISFNGSNPEIGIVRLNTNGSLDTTFSSDGVAFLGQLSQFISFARAIKIQSDGKIVVGGHTGAAIDLEVLICRFNSNGSLDTTFDSDGFVTYNFATSNTSVEIAESLAIQTDGKIVVGSATTITNFAGSKFLVLRYNTTGTLDNTFDGDGITDSVIRNASKINSLALQSDGKIVAAGLTLSDIAIARYNTNGSLDNTFNSDGIVTTFISGSIDLAGGMAMQTDGKMIVVGSTRDASSSDFDFGVIRFNPGGSLDNSFSSDGRVSSPIGTGSDIARAVAVQADGKIVVAGYSFNPTTNNNFVVVRYNSNGTLDTTFRFISGEIAPFDFDTDDDQANSVVIQSDGKIVVGGYATNPTTGTKNFAILILNSNGTVSQTITTSFTADDDIIKSLKLQSDGKIVACGTSDNGSNTDFALARYNTNGTLDTTFSADGKLTTAIGTGNSSANSLAIQPDGKIVAAGSASISGNSNFAITRYNTDGSLDVTSFAGNQLNLFGTGGIVTSNLGTNSVANAVAIQTDGKIVVGGTSDAQFTVARYQGSLAPTAATASINGRVLTASQRAIRNVTLTLNDTTTGEIKYTRTNPFGYYRFQDLEVGRSYVLSVNSKRFTFAEPTRLITLDEDLTDFDFVSDDK